MELRSALIALVAAAPPDATVTVSWIGELLAADTAAPARPLTAADALAVDLTVAEVAARFRKGVSTVRTWLARGELEGAYRLHGREWRVPPAAVAALQRSQARQHIKLPVATAKPRQNATLGEWRRHTQKGS